MGKTLLYGTDGRTPIAFEKGLQGETVELLAEAFGFVSGLTWARATSELEITAQMDRARQKLIAGILAIEEIRQAIEERFAVRMGVTPDGRFVCQPVGEEFATPPGPPASADMYR